jgi:hydrogenase-4 component B
MSFLSMGMPTLALLGLIAALFHILNHAIFKSLLFLSAGAVIRETHTRNMEKYGGLIKLMPQTALFFLIGSMAISALPPFNGFFSEWLTFQGLFQGIATLDFSAKWVFIAAAGSLAFTGGLALTCFVKAFGAAFLARPRSRETRRAKDPSLVMRLSMGTLAGLTLFLGLFSAPVTSILAAIGGDLSVFNGAASCVSRIPLGLSVAGFSTVSGPLLCGMLFCAFFVVLFTVRRCIYGGQKIRIGATWDCGADLTPRMEITATGFARSIITIFKGLLKPSIQHETEYHDAQSRYLPASRMVTLSIKDIHLSYLYKPIRKAIRGLSVRVKAIQTGNINIYILYIFVALLIALALVR